MSLKGSALLSHVDTRDKVNIRQKTKEQPCDPPAFPPDGPVELDFSKPEHSYSKPPDMDPLTIEESETTMSMASGELDTTSHNTDLFIRTISPSCSYDAGQGLLFDSVVDSIIVSNLSELELPLGHEEVVSSDLFVAQMGRGFIPPPKKSTCPRRGRGRGKPPTTVATFTGLDDPQGPAGMLANRLSQPVFPAGPEIVYIDTPNTLYSLDS